MYMLLGGVETKYRTMYEQAVEVVKKHLLFRPMTLDDRDILLSGTVRMSKPEDMHLIAEGTHLTCFAGGMLAIGSKIFNRPEELDVASKLTDGCVWAYESTKTGIMPEGFITVPCEDRYHCGWNVSRYWDAIDPYYRAREQQRAMQERLRAERLRVEKESREVAVSEEQSSDQGRKVVASEGHSSLHASKDIDEDSKEVHTQAEDPSRMVKRQLVVAEGNRPSSSSDSDTKKEDEAAAAALLQAAADSKGGHYTDQEALPATTTTRAAATDDDDEEASMTQSAYTPPTPPSHEDYAKSRIEEERLPPGFVSYQSRKYILR